MPTDKRTVTPRRRAANKAAAKQSTGPRTEEGKARSSLNSLRHGAFAGRPSTRTRALERSGSTARYERLRQSLASEWRPSTPQQDELVDSLAWLTFLRDEARQAFLSLQERRMVEEPVLRERKRWRQRHLGISVTDEDCINVGLACLETSPDKLDRLAVVLAELRESAGHCAWKKQLRGMNESPQRNLLLLCGEAPRAARLRKLEALWTQAADEDFSAKDPRTAEILALLKKLDQATEEEREVLERDQSADREVEALEDEEGPGLFPLDERGAEMLKQMEQLERQINAKIRLLLRLEQRTSAVEVRGLSAKANTSRGPQTRRSALPAAGSRHSREGGNPVSPGETGPPPAPGCQETDPADQPGGRPIAQIDGTKPTKPLESTDVPEELRKAREAALRIYGIDMTKLGQHAPVAPGHGPSK